MSETKMPDPDLVARFVGNAHGNLDVVKQMLSEHPELLNAVWQAVNETAIQAATQTGQREIAEFLIARGAPVDICTAAMLGDVRRVDSMLAQDSALAHARGSHDYPVLYHAALSGNPDVAELLKQYGGGEGMEFALHAAVLSGKPEMVIWLLANGARDVNVPNYEGKTPLTVALERGYFDIADILQSEGGVEAPDDGTNQ
jgi:ankyrin repeat protein